MGSTEPDRSLSSGMAIPQWMKQKAGERYDFDDTAFSPPSYDDNFFYIRYPKQVKKVKEKSKYNSINEFLEAKERLSRESSEPPPPTAAPQHTTACGPFIREGGMTPGFESDNDPAVVALRRKGPPALEGGFPHDADQSCGHSVVQVAQQMTGQLTGAVISSGIKAYVETPPRLRERRGSKSLPASPLATPQTSPKTGRRQPPGSVTHNRYFTPAVLGDNSGFSKGSILSRLLGSGEGGAIAKTRKFSEEDEEAEGGDVLSLVPGGEKVAELRRNKSTSALLARGADGKPLDEFRNGPHMDSIADVVVHKVTVIKPKPSELREMNFWTPTSM
ncbi:uncharacterized protein LOC124156162 [Ischnura elegans]|uniref:uncharacterized protein LOC124156162 n=1 Tax=Ischnura elegans TaxID=197161 RepID=UPI001ED8677A|nr:uncharacterized protein LOC124156162 [Ischnura elegans]